MRANEFVKKFRWGEAKRLVDASKFVGVDKSIVDIDDLKRLVESYELVELCGGLEVAKQNQLFLKAHELSKDGDYIDKAIADVESCL
ncbi:MAG: hypothetical protein RSE18_12075 [Acinetobacter sp.]